MLRLLTFGGCFLDRDGTRLEGVSSQRKGLALLTLLAADASGMSRESLSALLWSESNEERARTSLRQLIHGLRNQLAEPDLLLPSTDLRLNPSVVTSDVAEFREAIARGDLDAAASLYRGPFLDGFYIKGADGFERWAATERSALAQEAWRNMEQLAERAALQGNLSEATAWWRRLASVDPLSARIATRLMRALEAQGERAAALQHARVYEALVREELGGEPDHAVLDLAAQLRQAAPASPVARTAAEVVSPALTAALAELPLAEQTARAGLKPRRPLRAPLLAAAAMAVMALGARALWQREGATAGGDVRLAAGSSAEHPTSLVVLPFANVSGSNDDEHLADGLTDELIGALGRVPGLKVIGRTSAFALKGRGLGVRAIADTLGVSAVLEGSWRRDGSRLKVSAQLVGAPSGVMLWGDTYDRELVDVFAVQTEITRAIVGALRTRVAGASVGPIVEPSAPANPAAYELYLKGRYVFQNRIGPDGVQQAVRYFDQAIAIDPMYARAYSGLSDAYSRLAVFGYSDSREALTKAKAAARRGLALDSSLAEAQSSLAHSLLAADFAWKEAEQGFRRAIALDPGYIFVRAPFAICLMSQGRTAEAIAQLDTARLADPLSKAISNVLGRVYVAAGMPDSAIRTLLQVLELDPQLDLAHQQLGHAYLQKGMMAPAIAAFQLSAARSGPRDSAQLAYAYAVSGQRAVAEQIIRGLVATNRLGGALSYHFAMAYAGLGDRDAAFQWLDRGYTERASFMMGVKVEPGFTALRSDPRWALLLARMGLAP